jgi:Protein-tyrosine phosphatase
MKIVNYCVLYLPLSVDRAVEDWQQSTGIPSSPVIVQCSDGATQSGLLVVCYIVCEKMIVEGQVSVFHTVKAVKLQKPSVINTLVRYIG